jgi:inhibitor of KinA sporulation pathway (predicted exonuclease)
VSALEHLVVLDFEATCRKDEPPEPQEIIELPSVLVSLRERRVVAEHETFVRPVFHPVLSDFCKELTGIRQEDVDRAPPFPEAFAGHQAWLASHGLLERAGSFAFVTCGEWDLRSMLVRQCAASGVTIPRPYRSWINVKTVFAGTLRRSASVGMPTMLEALGLELEGRHHRGIDDCRNIARIVLALHARGARFEITSRLEPGQMPPLPLTLRCGDRVEPVTLKKRQLSSLLGLASSAFRAQIVAVATEEGAALDDEALADLPPGAVLRATAR